MAEFASKGVANTALGISIGSGVVSLLNSAGGLAGFLGLGQRNTPPQDSGDRPVTRYELGLVQENTLLKSQRYTDDKANAIQTWAAGANATMGFMGQQIAQLYSLTQLVVPNGNVSPGWGPAQVRPFPPFPQFPPAEAPTVSGGTTTTTGG